MWFLYVFYMDHHGVDVDFLGQTDLAFSLSLLAYYVGSYQVQVKDPFAGFSF